MELRMNVQTLQSDEDGMEEVVETCSPNNNNNWEYHESEDFEYDEQPNFGQFGADLEVRSDGLGVELG